MIIIILFFLLWPTNELSAKQNKIIKPKLKIQPELIDYVEKINGVDRKYFAGKKLIIPASLAEAQKYIPPGLKTKIDQPTKTILISKTTNLLACYDSCKLVYWAPITRGRKLSFTPEGTFAVQNKYRCITSRKYGNVAMPYALHIINNICIHQGPMVGRPASHGCIRLFKRHAQAVYAWATIGTIVIIE